MTATDLAAPARHQPARGRARRVVSGCLFALWLAGCSDDKSTGPGLNSEKLVELSTIPVSGIRSMDGHKNILAAATDSTLIIFSASAPKSPILNPLDTLRLPAASYTSVRVKVDSQWVIVTTAGPPSVLALAIQPSVSVDFDFVLPDVSGGQAAVNDDMMLVLGSLGFTLFDFSAPLSPEACSSYVTGIHNQFSAVATVPDGFVCFTDSGTVTVRWPSCAALTVSKIADFSRARYAEAETYGADLFTCRVDRIATYEASAESPDPVAAFAGMQGPYLASAYDGGGYYFYLSDPLVNRFKVEATAIRHVSYAPIGIATDSLQGFHAWMETLYLATGGNRITVYALE